MFTFDFFDQSSFESESNGLLLEKLEIKNESMTEMRFKRFFTKLILGSKNFGGPLDLSVKSLKVPTKPRREKNPLTKETLQSYAVKVELSDGQKVQMLVQFEGEGKLDAKTTGVIGEIKLNGQVIPLTNKEASSEELRFVIQKLVKGIAGNIEKYKAKAEKKAAKEAANKEKEGGTDVDTTGNDRNTRIGHDEDAEKLRRKLGDRTGGGLEDDDGAAPKKKSKAKQLEDLMSRKDTLSQEFAQEKEANVSIFSQLQEQEKRISELNTQIASAEETLASLANAA